MHCIVWLTILPSLAANQRHLIPHHLNYNYHHNCPSLYLRCELERLMMFSRNVFCGATNPRRPLGILLCPSFFDPLEHFYPFSAPLSSPPPPPVHFLSPSPRWCANDKYTTTRIFHYTTHFCTFRQTTTTLWGWLFCSLTIASLLHLLSIIHLRLDGYFPALAAALVRPGNESCEAICEPGMKNCTRLIG